jgi:hypothetical protein
MRSAFRHPGRPRRTDTDGLLLRDVAAMLRDYPHEISADQGAAEELAHDLIVVIRERVLREIAGYARENIR